LIKAQACTCTLTLLYVFTQLQVKKLISYIDAFVTDFSVQCFFISYKRLIVEEPKPNN